MHLENAIAFVKSKGNLVELARLQFILANENPSEEIKAQLFNEQQADGGWSPFWARGYSSVDATCFRLAKADQLGIMRLEKAIVRAIDFLVKRQSADGSWEEATQVADSAPPWATPGSLPARLYLTANCGFWVSRWSSQPSPAIKAAEYLQNQLDSQGQLQSFLHTHWLAGGLWQQMGWHETANRVFEHLLSRINDLAASNLAWLLTTLGSVGLTPQHPLIIQAVASLEKCQQSDGRWQSEDGPDHDIHSTLESLRALLLYKDRKP